MKLFSLTFVTLALICRVADCQPAHDPFVYKDLIKDFYNCLLNKEFVSLRDYYTIFGQHAEDEDILFFNNCDKTKSEDECDRIAREQLASWSAHRSLVFLELKNLKELITVDQESDIATILSKMRLKDNVVPSVIDIELDFSNGRKILFVLNNVEGERPYIIDIFLLNGSSIFKKIGTRSEVWSYKRLAMIDDADGYTNIRDGKGVRCMVKGKLEQNDIFFVYPNYQETWWLIEKLDCERGYVSRDRISLIGDLADRKRISLRDTITYIYSRPPFCD